MQIDRVYNNNVVQVLDDQGRELIVMGKGLGFQKKAGDSLDQTKIEKTFALQDPNQGQDLYRVYKEMDETETNLVMTIIHRGQDLLATSFETSLYIALADHIHYTIERTRQGIQLKNPLSWEVRKFYPQEFQLGLEAVALIEQTLSLTLGNDEAASIALHFVNAQKDGGLVGKNRQLTTMVVDMLEIVRLHFGGLADEDSVTYHRFVTHLQYFAQRVLSGLVQGQNDAFLYEQVQSNYPQAFQCTQKIKAYVKTYHDFDMSEDEQVYLTIHIQRQDQKS